MSEDEWKRGYNECDDPLTREHIRQLSHDAHERLNLDPDHPWSLIPRTRGRDEAQVKPQNNSLLRPVKNKFNRGAFGGSDHKFEVPVGTVPDAIDLAKERPHELLNQVAEAMGKDVAKNGHGFNALESDDILKHIISNNDTHAGLSFMGEDDHETKDYE